MMRATKDNLTRPTGMAALPVWRAIHVRGSGSLEQHAPADEPRARARPVGGGKSLWDRAQPRSPGRLILVLCCLALTLIGTGRNSAPFGVADGDDDDDVGSQVLDGSLGLPALRPFNVWISPAALFWPRKAIARRLQSTGPAAPADEPALFGPSGSTQPIETQWVSAFSWSLASNRVMLLLAQRAFPLRAPPSLSLVS